METNKPIIIRFSLFENRIGMWLNNKEQYHREDEHPAIIFPDGVKEYAINNNLYKIVGANGIQTMFL
jgi:hypothetical protein